MNANAKDIEVMRSGAGALRFEASEYKRLALDYCFGSKGKEQLARQSDEALTKAARLTALADDADAAERGPTREELLAGLRKIMPMSFERGADYDSVYFGDGAAHSTQAMTMNPQDWLDLEALLARAGDV